MKAAVGDRLIIRGHRVGEPDREAEIVEVRGEEGGPPYRVRWSHDETETIVFPGPDGVIRHHGDSE